MARKRIRTHANPLSYPDPIHKEAWADLKREGLEGVYLDMGCGQGDFIIQSAKSYPNRAYVGIEVRKAMSEKVNEKIKHEELVNVVCLTGNASISLESLFEPDEVKEVYINFPDPWMKPRTLKRRMVKDFVVESLHKVLAVDGKIYLMTDVKEIFDEFYGLLVEKFMPAKYRHKKEKSYWQKWNEQKGTEIYACCFVK